MIKTKKYSLRFVLTTLFAVLILSVGGLLAALNYTQNTKLLLSASDEIYDRASKEIVLNYRKTYSPVHNSLALLSHSSLAASKTFMQRLKYIGSISAALYSEPAITAIQIGYQSGDYFIARKLNTPELRSKFNSPKKARMVVDNISFKDSGESQLDRVYLDKHLHILRRDKPVKSDYDPRTRPWFVQAEEKPKAIAPYYFYFMQKVGTTLTMKMQHSQTVVATDITLDDISSGLKKSKMTELSELYLITSKGHVVASSNENENLTINSQGKITLKSLSELSSHVVSQFFMKNTFKERMLIFEVDGDLWQGAAKNIGKLGGEELYLFMFTPINELLKDAISIALNSLYLLLAIILMTLPVVWYISKRISAVMHQLAIDAKGIMNFDFSESKPMLTRIEEVDDLANAQALMKSNLSCFMGLINSLAHEKNFDSLLDKITLETLGASQADVVVTYLIDENSDTLKPNALKFKSNLQISCDIFPEFSLTENSEISKIIDSNECKYLYQNARHDDHWNMLAEELHDENMNLILLPLRNRQGEFMGMVVLAYLSNNIVTKNNQQQSLSFVLAFSEFAAVSLESKYLLKMQEDLLDAFIKLIAGAIDAKSPYTGGHCQRVPEITKMLAQAACDSEDKLFINYQLNEDQWQEIHIASWLHDCGKVTTPEYVVDKSTKLETIYDRIHEVRTRFEVLKRDAEIDYLKARLDGGDEKQLKQELVETLEKLDDDFEFVANCNQGGEFMEDEKIDRLIRISEQRWMRTLDKRLGVSWEEGIRIDKNSEKNLPAEEKLLSDNIEHIIERQEVDSMPIDNQWGFKLDVPEYKFNRGELYNLSITRGTLSVEERYIINGHMVQTIKMLEQLPYPSYLKNVPLIAGCHHETMDGKGYPKRLSKEDMPLTARMMAIADIFEALTASDRPYKKAKTLTASLRIMSFMSKDKHIDSDLFDLFLTSGVYMQYAEKYLSDEQIDEVDINQYLSSHV